MEAHAAPVAAGLLERDHEIEQLQAAVAAAAAGAGAVVALEGDPGIGKTALLAHATRAAKEAGMRVMAARGGELEREFAFGVVRQLFEAPLAAATAADRGRWLAGAAGLAASVVSAAPAHDAEPSPNPGAVLHGLYWLSANVSIDQPLLLAVDDAHWIDDASLAFLAYLARRAGELAILIVYASRVDEGQSAALPAVADPGLGSSVLRPRALSQQATALLVEQLLGQTSSGGFTRACHLATAGNPFLLEELARALQADGIVPDDANTAGVAQIVPRSIARATLARLRRLGPAAGELAFAVAVLGASAELRHAAELARLDIERAGEAADALAGAAILRGGRPLQFIHPIVRTTIYAELAAARRASHHKRAARMLAEDGAGDAAIAPHLLATEPSGDRWVVDRLRAAADALTEQAPAAACRYLERAHREPAPAPDRLALLLALGGAQLSAGMLGAVDPLREVLDRTTDANQRFSAARLLVGSLTHNGRMPEAMEVGHELLNGPAGRDADPDLRMRFEGELALVAQFAPSFAKAERERLGRYKDTLTGRSHGECLILTCLAFGAAHGEGSAAQTAELARRALAGGSLLDEHRPGSAAPFLAVWSLIYADELDEAELHFNRVLELARRRGWEGEFSGVWGSLSHVLLRQGRIAEAEAEALSVLTTLDPHVIARALLLACLMQTMIERADPKTWEPFLADHELQGDLAQRVMGGMLLHARGHVWLAAGRPDAALADFQALWDRDELSGQHTPAVPSLAPQALAYLQLGDHDAASARATEALEQARQWATPSGLAYALRAAGLIAGGAKGIELLLEAVAAVEQSPARYEHARAKTDLGAALRRAGRRRAARETLREALDLADRCGALRLAGLARDELIATGARPRRLALRGRDSLTPSERRVVQLAVDGLGNREIAQALFVTARTVEGHLTNAYMKLDISSREQLAAALADSG
ncbi:MAG TPA: AAA family ATPase [Solirubrobacteraceae bacterium]|nr:AAA family ATPase [Solirubrobacteraceae bacterium]